MRTDTPQKGQWFLAVENGKKFKSQNLGSFTTHAGNTYTRDGAILCTSESQGSVYGIDERELLARKRRKSDNMDPNRVLRKKCTDFIIVERDGCE